LYINVLSARVGDRNDAYTVLVGSPEKKAPLGGPKRKWENNIKMDFQEAR
jgi:hypothetical protein